MNKVLKTTFFTYANRPYEIFVLPYATSVLLYNEDARVEIVLDDSNSFKEENIEGIELIWKYFGKDKFLLRDISPKIKELCKLPNTYRFIETPQVITEYTYINDIDILILESVSEQHIKEMNKTGLPYSNIIRPSTERLTGLHFTKSSVYYPVSIPKNVAEYEDEEILYQIIQNSDIALPDTNYVFRPVHGYHLSLNRPPITSVNSSDWGGWNERKCKIYLQLKKNDLWVQMTNYFSEEYLLLLNILDLTLINLYTKEYNKESFKNIEPFLQDIFYSYKIPKLGNIYKRTRIIYKKIRVTESIKKEIKKNKKKFPISNQDNKKKVTKYYKSYNQYFTKNMQY